MIDSYSQVFVGGGLKSLAENGGTTADDLTRRIRQLDRWPFPKVVAPKGITPQTRILYWKEHRIERAVDDYIAAIAEFCGQNIDELRKLTTPRSEHSPEKNYYYYVVKAGMWVVISSPAGSYGRAYCEAEKKLDDVFGLVSNALGIKILNVYTSMIEFDRRPVTT